MRERGNQVPAPRFSTDIAEALGLLEQLVGCRAVRGDPLDVSFDPGNLGLKRFDPLVELLDANGVEVLPAKLDQRVAGFRRKEIVEVHRGPKLTGAGCKSIRLVP